MINDLPEGWEWKKLEFIADINMGQSPPGESYNYIGDGIPFLQGKAEFGYRHPTHIKYSNEPRKIAKKGSILISVRAPVGDVNIADIDYCIGRGLASISSNECDSTYLYYFLQSHKDIFENMGTGSTFKAINKSMLYNFQIPLPPLETQHKIVAILEKAEQIQRLQAEVDKHFDELIKSIFIDMFGDPVRNPKGWEVKKIEDICSLVTDGEHNTPRRAKEGIYLLSARNVLNHSFQLDDVDHIDDKEYERISKRIIPEENDILISCSGSVGRVSRVPKNFKFQMVRSVALIRPICEIINPIFLEYIFDTDFIKMQINQSINQSSQANLFQGKIRKLKVPIPKKIQQERFGEIIHTLDNNKRIILECCQLLDSNFNSLIQKAFKGELVK